jgi:hypothetical protein
MLAVQVSGLQGAVAKLQKEIGGLYSHLQVAAL